MGIFKRKINDDQIMKNVYSKNRLWRYTQFLIGITLTAIAYNIFILPNDIVYGVGGLGVIFYRTMGIDPSLVILIGSVILLILSYLLLGKEQTANSVIGSLVYPLMVKLTVTFCSQFDLGQTELIVQVLAGAVVSGFGLGLVFKSGFTTGGSDILNQIVAKYFKMSIGNSMFFTDGLIILSSFFVFGFQKFIYSVISMYIISVMADKVILGISQSKAFYIITEHETEVKKFITRHLSHGVTVLDGRGGYTGDFQKVIMCIIPTKEYFAFKEAILEIDKKAFFIVTDAYEVAGGK